MTTVFRMSLSVSGAGKAVFGMLDGAAAAYDDVTYVCISSHGCGIDDQLVTRGTIVAVTRASSNEVAATDRAWAAADEARDKALEDVSAAHDALDEISAAADDGALAAAEEALAAAREVWLAAEESLARAEPLYAEALRIRDSQTASG